MDKKKLEAFLDSRRVRERRAWERAAAEEIGTQRNYNIEAWKAAEVAYQSVLFYVQENL